MAAARRGKTFGVCRAFVSCLLATDDDDGDIDDSETARTDGRRGSWDGRRVNSMSERFGLLMMKPWMKPHISESDSEMIRSGA